mmetsp:Transcript_29662/g.72255  ORF Transcript_29662/g.72255 Transcript_29662/m.72255 type:complete len:258 (-) Transcript_29662:134-907(-)
MTACSSSSSRPGPSSPEGGSTRCSSSRLASSTWRTSRAFFWWRNALRRPASTAKESCMENLARNDSASLTFRIAPCFAAWKTVKRLGLIRLSTMYSSNALASPALLQYLSKTFMALVGGQFLLLSSFWKTSVALSSAPFFLNRLSRRMVSVASFEYISKFSASSSSTISRKSTSPPLSSWPCRIRFIVFGFGMMLCSLILSIILLASPVRPALAYAKIIVLKCAAVSAIPAPSMLSRSAPASSSLPLSQNSERIMWQ